MGAAFSSLSDSRTSHNPMAYIDDYIYYGSGHDCPRPYMEWGALSILSHIAGKKVWHLYGGDDGYFTIAPNLYVCNIGNAGSGKSTAMEQNERIMEHVFPSYVRSEAIQSAQHILKIMTQPECEITWKDVEGFKGTPNKIYTYRPFYCLVDEMTNFVSVDQSNMIGLLVGIFSRSSFGTGYKKDLEIGAAQRIENPYFSLMGCAIPEWVMYNLKIDLFVGGLGRRMIIVHAKKERETAFPRKPAGADAAFVRAVEHLKRVERFYGPMYMTPEAERWWIKWFEDPRRKNREDPILLQFHETQNIILLKVAISEALSENDFETRRITDVHLQRGYARLKALEPEIVRLTGGVGRNELAGVGVALLEHLRTLGGIVPEVVLMKSYHRYLRDPEFQELMNHYTQTGQLYVISNDTGKRLWLLPDQFTLMQKIADEHKSSIGDAIRRYFEAKAKASPNGPEAAP